MKNPIFLGEGQLAKAAMLQQQQAIRNMQIEEFVTTTAREIYVPLILEPLANAKSIDEVMPLAQQFADKAHMAALVLAAQFKMVNLRKPEPPAGG